MRSSQPSRSLAALLLLVASGACTRPATPATRTAPTPTPADATPAARATPPGGAGQDTTGGARPTGPQPRPYDRVVTRDARTKTGLFKVHQIGDRLLYEIPRRELNKDHLLLRRAIGGGGGANHVVRWERLGNRILLRQYLFGSIADTTQSVHLAVRPLAEGPIIASFNVESWGPDSNAVIDVTRLFTTFISELSGLTGVAADRSFIESVAAYPTNIEVEALQTGSGPATPTFGGAPAPAPGPGARPVTTSGRFHWSMLKLPERPMMARLHDTRVGFISTSLWDYGRSEHRTAPRRYIHRFRLEKKDPNAAVSEPVKPIVFYVDPATPAWLVPWVKKGIEDWKPAYEGAGFRNAIEAREAPSAAEDPNFSIHDARHSVIYWRASTVANATGGQTVDPRSGEIIKAEVNMFHNVMNLVRNWYFVQVSPLDPRAKTLPLPDSLMGRLVEYVVAHEVGHAIGFPHNMKSSSMYPADSIRSASFLRRMGGHVATLMDYSRYNYVAQPEDNIPVELLIPGVGPYDKFAVMWGHTPIPGARTPDEEKPTLDQWARMQDTVPWFRYETPGSSNDPGSLTEAVGDADAVKSTTLALKNMRRVASMLLPATERPGEDYSLLREMYDDLVSQWGRYMSHVAAVIGGAESQEKAGTGPRFFPVSQARNREAMRFLAENAFRAPAYLIDADILRRVEPEGAIGRIRNAQNSVITSLVSDARMNRLIEYEALGKKGEVYTVGDMLADLRKGVWTELTQPNVQIDVYRRNLQRAYLEVVDLRVNPPPATAQPALPPGFPPPPARFTTDTRPLLRGELVELQRLVNTALARTSDSVTRLHLQDVKLQIDRIIDPREKR